MLARLSFTDFDGATIMKKISNNKSIDKNLVIELCPKIVEGTLKLKNWSENL